MTSTPPHYDRHWSCQATLSDGTAVVLRLVGAEDKELLRQGFAELSERSRYLRFFANKAALSEDELARLTSVDGQDHVAVGARTVDEPIRGIGIARFIRDLTDPTLAEPAVAVVDAYQGLGLGALLVTHLAQAARERGVERFRFCVLAENERMIDLLAELDASAGFVPATGGVLDIELTLPKAPATELPANGAIHRLLSQAAESGLALRWKS